MQFRRGYRDINRISHVANALFKEGLGYFVGRLNLKVHLPVVKRFITHPKPSPETLPIRIRRTMEALGGAYVKLGQLLSLRPDLVPEEYCNEFKKLQDNVRPFSYAQVEKIFIEEFRKSPKNMFSFFDKDTLGSASIGQVHIAKLRNGKKVVVKVQRPSVRDSFAADIDIMYYLAHKLEKYVHLGNFSPKNIVKEFERYTKNELDYTIEANNIEQFYKNFTDSGSVKIPKVYKEYSSGRILTMEFIDGVKLSELEKSAKRYDKKKIVENLVNATIKQVFETGIFHADAHPGNVLVCDGSKVALLDFGIVGSLDEGLKETGMDLFIALVRKDIPGVTKALLKSGEPSSETDIASFKKQVAEIVKGWHGRKLAEVRITYMLHLLFNACLAHKIDLPVDLLLLGKALVTVEGTCLMLDPSFDFVNSATPYAEKILKKRKSPKAQIAHFRRKASEISGILSQFPEETLALIEKLKRGVIKIDIEDQDIKHLGLDLDRSSNRLSYAMIIAAFIVAGALLARIGPVYAGYPVFTATFFILAVLLSAILFVSILREGR